MAQVTGGTVLGHVTDRSSGLSVAGAVVNVVGTAIRAATNADGTYRLRGVPAGSQVLRAVRLGFAAANSAPVTVVEGGTATVDLVLVPASVTLTTVQVTATGQSEESREIATLTPQFTPDSLNLAAAPTFASVLEGSAPGVQVFQPSGTSGTGAKIRIQGSSSVSLSNEPLLVIDGVEAVNEPNAIATSFGVGGQSTSRIDDINPDDIASVQVLEGPAATGLYGTAAANGVIVVTTKRGQAGKAHWDGFVENGELHDDTNYPLDYILVLARWRREADAIRLPHILDHHPGGHGWVHHRQRLRLFATPFGDDPDPRRTASGVQSLHQWWYRCQHVLRERRLSARERYRPGESSPENECPRELHHSSAVGSVLEREYGIPRQQHPITPE